MLIREIFQDKILTFSNLLTLVRVIAGPFLGYYIYMEYRTGDSVYLTCQIIMVCIIVISDFSDGFLARHLKQVTRLGQFLDPVADKFAGLFAMTFLMLYKLSAVSLAFAGIVYILSPDCAIPGLTLKQLSIFLVVLFYILGGILYVKTYVRDYLEKKV
jgi:phosphatidylglycerophosphate synthase